MFLFRGVRAVPAEAPIGRRRVAVEFEYQAIVADCTPSLAGARESQGAGKLAANGYRYCVVDVTDLYPFVAVGMTQGRPPGSG